MFTNPVAYTFARSEHEILHFAYLFHQNGFTNFDVLFHYWSWQQSDSNFSINATAYPHFDQVISAFHKQGIRVKFKIGSFLNSTLPTTN